MWIWEIIKLSMWIVGSVIVLSIVYTFWAGAQQNKKASQLTSRGLSKSKKYEGMPSFRGDTLVLMMHPRDRTALIVTGDGRTKELPFSAFQDAKINEDGHTVFDTRRQGMLGRAAVGGVVFGGAGAVIGALTAKQVASPREIVTRISIDVTTNDPEFPLLSWTTFAPIIGANQIPPAEVMLQRQNAVNIYNQLAPIFAPAA